MAVAIVLLAIVSILAVGMAIVVFQKPTFDLAFEYEFWEDESQVEPNLLLQRNILYSASLAIPIFMTGVLVLWAVLAMTRREDY